MQYNPFVPFWILILGFIVSVLLVGLSYWRRLRGQEFFLSFVFMSLRILALVVIVMMLAGPQIQTRKKEKVHTVLPVLLDASESMALEDQSGNASRFVKARDLLVYSFLKPLSENFDVRLYTFSSFLEPQTEGTIVKISAPHGSSTDIGGAIVESIRREGKRVDAVVLLSDGVHNYGTHPSEVAPVLKQEGIKAYTVGIGAAGEYKDLEIGSVSVPSLVFMNEEVPITFDLRSYGYKSISADVVLEGEVLGQSSISTENPGGSAAPKPTANKVVLTSKKIDLSEKWPQARERLTFTLGERGVYRLTLSTAVQSDERVKTNNQKQIEINVTRERMHVLFLEGHPRWGYGFLFRALRSDPRIALHAVLEIAENTYYQQKTGEEGAGNAEWKYPKTIEDLKPYDMLILGDLPKARLGDEGMEAIAKSVSERGLGLVLIGGRESLGPDGYISSPLAKALPVDLTGNEEVVLDTPLSYFITPEGVNHPIFKLSSDLTETQSLLNSLPDVAAYWPLGKNKPAAMVLMKGKDDSGSQTPILMATQKYGRGRVAVMATDRWYRWSFMKGANEPGPKLLQSFWQGLVRWVITGETDEKAGLSIKLDQEQFLQGKDVDIRVHFSGSDAAEGAKPSLTISGPDIPEKALFLESAESPGWYKVAFQPPSLGAYRLTASVQAKDKSKITTERTFRVEPFMMEQKSAGMNEQLLRTLSADTGGAYFKLEEATNLPTVLPTAQREIERTTTTPLWNSPFLYGLLFLLLSAEWLWRRLKDLP